MRLDAASATFTAWLSNPEIPELPHQLAVGWSGGADSTALLLALKAKGHDVQAWHVDHGWRESSQQECEALAQQARSWGIPFFSVRLAFSGQANREAEAREGRFAQFLAWSRESGITTLCLAHNRDDQAETVCMRLLQGAGTGGCRGMQSERIYQGLRIVRPLLHVGGTALRETLSLAGVTWFEDPSNHDTTIWRNRIRHELFPRITAAGLNPQQLFLRWQRQAQRLALELEAGADTVLAQATSSKDGLMVLPWAAWANSSAPIRARVLQRLMAATLGEGVTPGRRHILLVEQWTARGGRGGLDLSGCRLQRRQGRLHLQPRTSVCAAARS